MKKILIIEDDIILADEWRDALSNAGYQVTVVETASDAKVLVESEIYDAFIVDLFYVERGELMPDGGLRFLGHIDRKKKSADGYYRYQPVIAVSGYKSGLGENDKLSLSNNSRLLGATEFLQKPFANEKLLSTLDRALNTIVDLS